MSSDPTRNTRAARYRAATKETGGAQINVTIGADAAIFPMNGIVRYY